MGRCCTHHYFSVISKLIVEVSISWNNMQIFESAEETEDTEVIEVLFCNYAQWAGQPNHY
eukprot:6834427-Heterocapsa_arctica.AAC.1